MSSIDTSGIDPTKPVAGNALTANMRSNFAAIKTQLENAGVDIDTIDTFLAGIDSDSTNDQTKSEIDALILKGLANGYATLDASAKIPTAQLPALSLTEIFEVASEAAMIALTAQEGDIAVRSDENKTYAHNGGVAGTAADWTLLRTPTDVVTSVAGNVGVVTAAQLKTAYEGLSDTNAYTDSEKTFLAGLDTAIDSNATSTAITIDASENVTFGGNISLGAGKKVIFDSSKIEIFHDSSNGYYYNNTGSLIFNVGGVALTLDTSQNATFGGNVSLADNKYLYLGGTAGANTYLYNTGGGSYYTNKTGNIVITERVNSGLIYLQSYNSVGGLKDGITIGGATPKVGLYYNGLEKFATSSSGTVIHGGNTAGVTLDVDNTNTASMSEVYLSGSATDVDNALYGIIWGRNKNNTTERRIGYVAFRSSGTTANNRGGKITFGSKLDGTTTISPAMTLDNSVVAGETRLLIYDVDNATLERVTVGAANSGGSGYKVLRIPN